jgi:hypothetical protein
MSAMMKPMHRAWQAVAAPAEKIGAAAQKLDDAATAKPMEAKQLLQHMLATYRTLRFVMFWIAFLLPVVLVGYGLWLGVPIQHSFSAYFYADHEKFAALRTVFVGVLCALGVALIAYRGASPREDWALNFAGAFAIGVALFPMVWPEPPAKATMGSGWHVGCAQSLFALLFYVAIFRKDDTIEQIADENVRKIYKAGYIITAWFMVLSPASAWAITQLVGRATHLVIALEWAGIWAFAFFWLVKSLEMRESKFEEEVASQRMKLNSDGKAVALSEPAVSEPEPTPPVGAQQPAT